MKHFIVVEGNECSGKSTLVEELRGTLAPQGWDTKSLAHRPGDPFHRYLYEYITADRVVFNRSHYAELVFGRLYRGGTPFSDEQLNALDTIVGTYGLVIFCDLSVDMIEMRLQARNRAEVLYKDDTPPSELRAIAAAFETVFLNRNVVRYSARTPSDLETVLAEVERRILPR